MSDADDEALLAQMMRGVTPLTPEIRNQERTQAKATTPIEPRAPKAIRRPASRMHAPQEMNDGCLQASGVSAKQLQRLRSGQYPVEHTIDLHGKTQNVSIVMLEQAVQQSIQQGMRVLRIIHGRGLHSPDGQGVLKRLTYDYLQHGSIKGFVLAVVACPQGGSGACLVLLRRDKRKSFGL